MKTFYTMLKTELRLSFRGMDMVIFALCLPLAALVLLGLLYGTAPAFEGAGYTFVAQSFGALSAISICAGGVMGLPLVVSDYRSRKILRRFRVTPVSPAMLLLVQLAVYALYAAFSLLLLFLAGKAFFGLHLGGSPILFLLSHLLVTTCTFSIGMLVGGVARDTKTAGVIASLLYFPMLLFSGATLPYEILPGALQRLSDVLPLTQGIKLLKASALGLPMEGVLGPVVLMAALTALCAAAAIRFFRWE